MTSSHFSFLELWENMFIERHGKVIEIIPLYLHYTSISRGEIQR